VKGYFGLKGQAGVCFSVSVDAVVLLPSCAVQFKRTGDFVFWLVHGGSVGLCEGRAAQGFEGECIVLMHILLLMMV